MNITDVTSYIASIPRKRSLNTYYGDIPDTKTITVLVQTDEEITGIGQTLSHAPHYGDTAESIKANIDNYIKPAILGKNPFDIEYLFELDISVMRALIVAPADVHTCRFGRYVL